MASFSVLHLEIIQQPSYVCTLHIMPNAVRYNVVGVIITESLAKYHRHFDEHGAIPRIKHNIHTTYDNPNMYSCGHLESAGIKHECGWMTAFTYLSVSVNHPYESSSPFFVDITAGINAQVHVQYYRLFFFFFFFFTSDTVFHSRTLSDHCTIPQTMFYGKFIYIKHTQGYVWKPLSIHVLSESYLNDDDVKPVTCPSVTVFRHAVLLYWPPGNHHASHF